jgi:serine/threonine protein kinase
VSLPFPRPAPLLTPPPAPPPSRVADEYWSNVSDTAKDFVRACLTIDPASRPTAEEALRHRWLASDEPHYVEDERGQMTNLLPQIQRGFDAKKTCTCAPSSRSCRAPVC